MDAMLSNRHYRDALSREEVHRELNECSGTQFDPEVAEAAVPLLETGTGEELPSSF